MSQNQYGGITNELQQEFASSSHRGGGGGRGFYRGGFDPTRGGRGGFDPTRGGRGGFDPTRGGRGGFDPTRGGRGGFDPTRGGGRGGFDPTRARGGRGVGGGPGFGINSVDAALEYQQRYVKIMASRGGIAVSQYIPPQEGQQPVVLDDQGQPIKNELQVSAGRTVKGQHILLNPDCTFAFKIPICDFYMRQGSCRHQDRCGKVHVPPLVAPTVMLPMLYVNPKFIPHDERGRIINYDEKFLAKHFYNFYERVWMSMMHFGRIRELQVCDNMCPHLLGNVYVCYEDEASAANCVQQLKHKKFEGILVLPELVPVTNFNEAACGDYDNGVCARGEACNFLHVLRPPKALVLDLLEAQDIFWEEKAKEAEEVALRQEEMAMLKAMETPLFDESAAVVAAAAGAVVTSTTSHHQHHRSSRDDRDKKDKEHRRHDRDRDRHREKDSSRVDKDEKDDRHLHRSSRSDHKESRSGRGDEDRDRERRHRSSRDDEDRSRRHHDDSRRRRRSESPSKDKQKSRSDNGKNNSIASMICHICGQLGHGSRDCPLKLQL